MQLPFYVSHKSISATSGNKCDWAYQINWYENLLHPTIAWTYQYNSFTFAHLVLSIILCWDPCTAIINDSVNREHLFRLILGISLSRSCSVRSIIWWNMPIRIRYLSKVVLATGVPRAAGRPQSSLITPRGEIVQWIKYPIKDSVTMCLVALSCVTEDTVMMQILSALPVTVCWQTNVLHQSYKPVPLKVFNLSLIREHHWTAKILVGLYGSSGVSPSSWIIICSHDFSSRSCFNIKTVFPDMGFLY